MQQPNKATKYAKHLQACHATSEKTMICLLLHRQKARENNS